MKNFFKISRPKDHKVTFTIVRHGQTDANINRWLQGHSQNPLNDTGLIQADLLAKRLKDEKIDVIYSSDLMRAKQTCETVAAYHPKAPIHYIFDLRENDMGSLQTQMVSEAQKLAQEAGLSLKDYIVINGGEGPPDLTRRVRRWWDEILEEIFNPLECDIAVNDNDNEDTRIHDVLIVSHGGTISALLIDLVLRTRYTVECTNSGSLANPSHGQLSYHGNTGISQVVVHRNKYNKLEGRVVRLNDMSHLDGMTEPPKREKTGEVRYV